MVKIMMDPAVVTNATTEGSVDDIHLQIEMETRARHRETQTELSQIGSESRSEISSERRSESRSEISSESHSDHELFKEYKENINTNTPYHFTDIVDDKHTKYMQHYALTSTSTASTTPLYRVIFWGIGIENESYLMLNKTQPLSKLRQKRERYSVDYFKNFKSEPLQQAMKAMPPVACPVYINAHTFLATDANNEHRTLYDEFSTPNPKFTQSIHDVLMAESAYYREVYDHSVVFDGDSIEFITQQFYNTTVADCVAELCTLKQRFLKEISPYFTQWGEITFPAHNHGLVTFLTTHRRNLGLCNNGTLHLNLTLPTVLENGIIANKHKFAEDHLRFVACIKMLEPLLVACYGTPDVFSVVDENALGYSIGSLRVSLSRYISLQTFDVSRPVNGKLLLQLKPTDPAFWYNQMQESPYVCNKEIGFDVNFNKFKNHGVELRFFDWFPEAYVGDVLNLLILLAEHSLRHTPSIAFDKSRYNRILAGCVRDGFRHTLSAEECNVILQDLQLPTLTATALTATTSAHDLLSYISDVLYDTYKDGDIVQRMSPRMARPCLHNYNKEAYAQLTRDVYNTE